MSCKWPISPDLNSQVGDPDSILSEKKIPIAPISRKGQVSQTQKCQNYTENHHKTP